MSLFRSIAGACLALLLAAGGAGEGEKKPFPHAILTPTPPQTPPDVLLQRAGDPDFRLAELKGKWVWLYVGYGSCPDVCPAALNDVAEEYRQLKRPDAVQVLFISVDPRRDTPEKLKQYVAFYHPAFVGATGAKDALDTLIKPLGLGYVIDAPSKPGGDYSVSHSNLITVLDPEGRYVATYVPGAEKGKLGEDFNKLTATGS